MTTPENEPQWNQPPGYPQQPPPAYPPSPAGYPPAPGGYPQSPSAYPPAPQGYPPAPGGYPQTPQGYPPAPGGYPQTPPGAPAPQGYPPAQGYPPGQYPPGQAGYPQPPAGAPVPQGMIPPAGGAPIPPATPAKKTWGGRLIGIGGTVLLLIIVAVVKLGAGTLFNKVTEPDPPANAWAGTPAESFASGEAGLVFPAAAASGPFSVEEVTDALSTVKQALVAGRLDERMLYDHDTSSFEALFSEFGREDLATLYDDGNASVVMTWIAPGHTLIDDGVRHDGEVAVRSEVLDGLPILVVETNFVWVYAFTGELKEPGDHLVTVHDQVSWAFPKAEEVDPADAGMFLYTGESSASNIDCDLYEQEYLALGAPVFADVTVDTEAPFDPNGSMEIPDELAC